MKTNPGGQISPSEVIGRDELIRRLWRVLDRQSLVLSAERRMGKTCIVKKMVEEAEQDKVLPIYHDLEGIRTPLEFVEVIFQDVEAYLFNLLQSRLVNADSEMTRRVLTTLQRDHYVIQQPDSRFCFRFPLIRRSWRIQRGLGS